MPEACQDGTVIDAVCVCPTSRPSHLWK